MLVKKSTTQSEKQYLHCRLARRLDAPLMPNGVSELPPSVRVFVVNSKINKGTSWTMISTL